MEKKEFLDKIGVQYLWDKINEYFSQIGHRHETSDVNGLDEYMEENAKAIRDTEKVIEILPTLPLYPSEEQLGIIYACNGRLYRAKKLNTLTLDFSKIPTNEEGYVTKEIFMDFINQNGMNIVNDCDCWFNGGNEIKHNSLLTEEGFGFRFEQRNDYKQFNYWNSLYIKGYSATYQSDYNEDDEESYIGYFKVGGDDLNDNVYSINSTTSTDYPPVQKTTSDTFGNNGSYSNANYIDLFYIDADNENDDIYHPFLLKSLTLQLASCASREDYENNIFSDFLVWEEISEEELPIEDTTPATEDTRKRFYREIENNNIYVTDAEYNPGAGGFIIDIVHPKTGGQINDGDELREYIDPSQVWTNGVNGVEQIYADNRYWLNNLGERVTITPIRMGTKNASASICLSTKEEVDLYFSPYISMSYPSQEAVIEQDYTTIEVNDAVAGETNEYEVVLFDNINLLDEKWTIVHVPASQEVYVNTSRRCYLHKIVKKGEGEGDRYYWSQIAKIQDIEDKINALPEVARTGSYTDLFNKPCIGDVQTYDWPNSEDLPIIEEGQTDSCENRLKQLLRWNNSLYTAVQNESGLSLDLREFSRNYKTQGYCGNSLRNFIFQDRIDITNAAYEDYYVSGNNILIQNTKGRGMQLGSSNECGNVLLAMRDEGDNKRFLFNEVEVNLQSWNGPDSDIKDYTTDNGNVYVEIGTSECVSSGWELFEEGEMKESSAYIRSTNGTPTDVFINILDEGYTNVNYNGEAYNVIDYFFDSEVGAWLLRFDVEISVVEGEYVTFVDHETPGTEVSQILTPQKTENVWFKRYSDDYKEEWVETEFDASFVGIKGDVLVYAVKGPSDEEVINFLETLNQGDRLRIDDTIMVVNKTTKNSIGFDYIDNYPEDHYPIDKPQRTYINNPVLKETVKLTGTNCDYIKIWTDEIGEQYGKRCVVKGITFNDLKYEYDPNPTYNRDIYKKDYWKQISGNGSIKVIDLTGNE